MTDGTGGQTYGYDDNDVLTTKNVIWTGFAAKTISYGFYANGSRKSMTADGRSFSYGYDGVGRMNSLLNDNSETTRYAYQDNGWLQSKTLSNGVVTTFTRDPQGRLRDLANKTGAGALLSDFSVSATGGYDGIGNRLSVAAIVSGAPSFYNTTRAYTYDYGQSANPQASRSQLTYETSTYSGDSTYAAYGYDGTTAAPNGTSGGPGNRTGYAGFGHFTYNADNQTTNTGYAYDGNGNPTAYNTKALNFDPENRLTAYSTAQTDGYDGNGLRTWKQTTSVRAYFLYDGTQPVVEEDTAGRIKAINTFGAGGLVSRRIPSAPQLSSFYTFDERDNVSQRIINTGTNTIAVYSSDTYNANGLRTTTATSSVPDPFGFAAQAGYYTDAETGLILCTHRYYDPRNGRWLTRDPISYRGGVNLYGYCGNDPGSWVDPSGDNWLKSTWYGIAYLLGFANFCQGKPFI